MADTVEELDDLIPLLLLVAIGYGAYWLFKNLGPTASGLSGLSAKLKALSDLSGGAGTPGTPQYVSPVANVQRWGDTLVGSPEDQAFNASSDPYLTYVTPLDPAAANEASYYNLDGTPKWWTYFIPSQPPPDPNDATISSNQFTQSVESWAQNNNLF
jgi:hypothetical protein